MKKDKILIIKIEEELKDELKKMAKGYKISMSELVRRLLKNLKEVNHK